MYGACFTGIAAMEQLDITAAYEAFRTARHLAHRIGGRSSHALRLAGAILADLLYEQGNIDDAEQLLDESRELGSEGGVVGFMLATYGTGARIKALRGNRTAAEQRLREGIEIAAHLSLPRLAARIENERIRAGLVTDCLADRRRPTGTASDGIATIPAELDTDSTIRLLFADPDGMRTDQAVTLAAELRASDRQWARPRAELRAHLLLVCALHAAGRCEDAVSELVPAVLTCTEHHLIRPLPTSPACSAVPAPETRKHQKTLISRRAVRRPRCRADHTAVTAELGDHLLAAANRDVVDTVTAEPGPFDGLRDEGVAEMGGG